MAENQNIFADRLRHKQNTQDNIGNLDSEPDEQSRGTSSSLTSIEYINERITKLEYSIVELTNTINGVMNELMDQKSILNMMKNNIPSDNQGNVSVSSMQKSGNLLRPRHQHNVNVRSDNKDNVSDNDSLEGSSRVYVRHNPDTDATRESTRATSNYIIADIDKSARETDNTPFTGEYIIANDSPTPGQKKKEGNIHYNEAEDVVVYENNKK